MDEFRLLFFGSDNSEYVVFLDAENEDDPADHARPGYELQGKHRGSFYDRGPMLAEGDCYLLDR